MKKFEGFSVLEALIVIAVIALLVAVTYLTLNPSMNISNNRNALRKTDVIQIADATRSFLNTEGRTLAELGTIATCPSTTKIGKVTEGIDLGAKLVPDFAVNMPVDPSLPADSADTGYTVCSNASGKLIFNAALSENNKTISIIK